MEIGLIPRTTPAELENRLVTADELLRHREWDPCELIRGKVTFLNYGYAVKGRVSLKILMEVAEYVRTHACGEVFGANTGFILSRNPDTVRAPSLMYFSHKRISAIELSDGYLEIPPDLAVNIVSPLESTAYASEKVASHLEAGVKVVWVVDPDSRRAEIYRPGQPVETIGATGALSAEEILPGLLIPLQQILPE